MQNDRRVPRRARGVYVLSAIAGILAAPPGARATWSIIIIDTESREIAIGAATCLTEFDLQAGLPMVLVDVGAAAAQSLVDVNASNRIRIHDGMVAGLRPQDILEILADEDTSHQGRQYGIATVDGRAITFTGSAAGDFAGGVIGEAGPLVYAIQGNVLTGSPVIDAAEDAVINTAGDLPAKLMAAMEAAQAMGGDGRCSCSQVDPTVCGSPPFTGFEKAAHIGFMIVTRTGDTDGVCTAEAGCANGDYFLNFNVANQSNSAEDPVFQMRDLFDQWRADHTGHPDAVQTTAVIDPPAFVADGTGAATMTITVRDWQGAAVTDNLSVQVEHADDSAGTTSIGTVIDDGGGMFRVALSGSELVGRDVFRVTVDDGSGPVVVIPRPTLLSFAAADQEADGDVDSDDFALFQPCVDGPGMGAVAECLTADLNGSATVDLADAASFQRQFTGPQCVELFIDDPPEPASLRCALSHTLSVAVTADPPARFQWFFEGDPIAGATDSEYTIESVGNEDVGLYHVEVRNSCGVLATEPVEITTLRPCL